MELKIQGISLYEGNIVKRKVKRKPNQVRAENS